MPRTTSRANALRAGTGPRIFSLLLVLGVGLAYSGLVAFCSFQPSQAQGARISRRAEGSGTTLEKPKAGSEWRLGVGRAIDVLRRDVAGLFSRKRYTPDFSIYSPDIDPGTCQENAPVSSEENAFVFQRGREEKEKDTP